jgi:hypothetical protein
VAEAQSVSAIVEIRGLRRLSSSSRAPLFWKIKLGLDLGLEHSASVYNDRAMDLPGDISFVTNATVRGTRRFSPARQEFI